VRRTLAVVLVVAAVVCTVLGLTHRPAARAAAPLPVTPATAVVSARRLPAALGGLVADRRLTQRLTALLADPALASTQDCLEVRVGGAPMFSRAAGSTLTPASNLKLLTALAVLTRIGPQARLVTSVVAPRAPVKGVIDGPLYLVGGGDPLLATAAYRPTQTEWTASREPVTRLEDLADKVKAAGVTSVAGVVGDDSRYDAQRTVPTWKASYVSSGEIGPVGALEVNGGFTLSARRKAAAADPATSAAAELTTLLRARGVAVGSGPSVGSAPPGSVPIAVQESLPVGEIVGVMLRESDNLAAEMLTKELGKRFGGAGSWAAGVKVINDTLQGAHVPTDGLVLVDGSGLDRGDRASCHTLVSATSDSGAVDGLLAAALPRAGSCGTLVKRFVGQAAAGRVRAKTGSLTGVAALTGYVDRTPPVPAPPCPPPAALTATGGPSTLTFSLLANNVGSDAAGAAIEDRVAAVLVTYPEVPPLAPLGPGS